MKILSIKNLAIVGTIVAAIATGVWFTKPSEAAVCDAWINVIACGTPTHQSLKSTYYGRSDIKALWQWNYINDAMIEGKGMHTGTVYKDGRIVVGNRVVATDAKTVQRNTRYPAASYGRETVGGHSYYKFTTQNSFVYNQFEAFVWLDDNGKFVSAIIKDCGNPVWGTPTPPPVKPNPPKPTPAPSLTCDALQKTALSRNSFRFSTKATAKDGATIKSYTYDFGDGKKQETTNSTIDHVYAKPGSYRVTVTVNGNANGAVSKSSTACTTTIEVQPEPEIQVCDLKTSTIITIKKSEFDKSKHSEDLADCEKLQACDLETGVIVTIKKKEYNKTRYSENLKDCEKEVCRIKDKQIVTISLKEYKQGKDIYTEDMSKCGETPPPVTPVTPVTPTPPELPKTGVSDIVMQALGLGSLATAAVAYMISRKNY